jgi:hypothetical protein
MPSLLVCSIAACVVWSLGCGSSAPSQPAEPARGSMQAQPVERNAAATQPWSVPDGFRGETIPFPLEFAPGLAHKGVEELRFAPGFFDPSAPGYWSYTFVWRTEDPATLDAAAMGTELTAYFRGLIDAVDSTKQIADRDAIVVRATPAGARLALAARVFDAFKTKQALDLTGWAERRACGTGALWSFVLAPSTSTLRPQLEALAAEAACGQPLPPPPPP